MSSSEGESAENVRQVEEFQRLERERELLRAAKEEKAKEKSAQEKVTRAAEKTKWLKRKVEEAQKKLDQAQREERASEVDSEAGAENFGDTYGSSDRTSSDGRGRDDIQRSSTPFKGSGKYYRSFATYLTDRDSSDSSEEP